MKDKGILIGEDGDVLVASGELVIGNTLWQNQYLILGSHPGEWKEFPTLGVGISDVALDYDMAGWSALIKDQLEADGMTVECAGFSHDMNLNIVANYED